MDLTPPSCRNLFAESDAQIAAPDGVGREQIDTLMRSTHTRVEWITSRGDHSGDGFWYDQDTTEWVLLVRGRATLVFKPGGPVDLAAGDCLTIPAHRRHRVESTSHDAVWLAVHSATQTGDV